MKKFILGACACLLGASLFVTAEVPEYVSEKYAELTTSVNELVAKEISSYDERVKEAAPLEYEVAMAIGKVNELGMDKTMTQEEFGDYTEKYGKIWNMLITWKGEADEAN